MWRAVFRQPSAGRRWCRDQLRLCAVLPAFFDELPRVYHGIATSTSTRLQPRRRRAHRRRCLPTGRRAGGPEGDGANISIDMPRALKDPVGLRASSFTQASRVGTDRASTPP